MGNSEGQTLVLEQLVGLSMFTPHELWAHRIKVITIAEKAISIEPAVRKLVVELKTADYQDEFCPVFCRLLEDLDVANH